MDRRQRKTREAIFASFSKLLSRKNFNQITVGEIIELADIGRATFYAHFETKDYLLKEHNTGHDHRHIFDCDGSDSVILHLFRHLQNNDNNILSLLSSENNELFLTYFRAGLENLIIGHLELFPSQKAEKLPEGFWCNHVAASFIETLKWWVKGGLKESPELITEYFFAVL